ncbi:endo-1,3;1,4-beta-D-glucanase-like [Andrographis paniculata]|uniref:endo-1,3;1,4-beta-D-glucanase-like n=1 Tax=Andrographis paniculata TaxID=175694 RepID=UPI0021E96B34|nr:endo-1,3;1,4-beta-D-glucanase-like [Andrographis paniculata]
MANQNKLLLLLLVAFAAAAAFVISAVSIHDELIENSLNKDANSIVGRVRKLGGVKSYVVSGSSHCDASIILISDVYGFGTPHLRMIADKVAGAGFYAVVPDFMNGDPFVVGNNQTEWLIRHRPEEVHKHVGPFFDAIKRKGVKRFGAAGFCWGGKVAVDLLNNLEFVKVGVLLHPTYTSPEDIQKIRVPLAILGGELDKTASPALLKQYEDILKANGVENFVKVYPNVKHGWTLKYNDTDEPAVKSAAEAHTDMLNWFIKYLK